MSSTANLMHKKSAGHVSIKKFEPLEKDHEKRLLNSVLFFQMLIYYHFYFLCFYYITNIIGYIWKKSVLYYPNTIFNWEISTFCFHAFLDIIRWHLANKGNKTKRRNMLILMIILSIPVLIGNYFFMNWQTYVHKYDLILNIVSWIIIYLEILASITSISTFQIIKTERFNQ